MKKIFSILISVTIVIISNAQTVGIGTNSPNSSSLLDITSTAKGLLIPRMTSAQRSAIVSPANGLMVYDITTNSFWYYNSAGWTNMVQASGGGGTLTLPYNTTVSLTTTAFKIKNDEFYNAIEGESTFGTGISGKSTEGPGVSGTSTTHNGVYGFSTTGNGVYATSSGGNGLFALSTAAYGIYTSSNQSAGIYSQSTNGSAIVSYNNNSNPTLAATNNNSGQAVKGTSVNGIGIEGTSTSNYGVKATSTSGTAFNASSGSGFGIAATSSSSSAIYAFNNNSSPTIIVTNSNASGNAINANSSLFHSIVGTTQGTTKAGIWGEATGSGGYGVYGTSSSDQGYGIYGHNLSGIGVYGYSNTGTGVKALSNSGLALEVNGKLKISGGNTNPSAGAILTSDASGNAVWKNIKIAFSADDVNANYASLPDNTWTRVHFGTEEYDYGNNYNLHVGTNPGSTSSIFTVPVSGVYHLNVILGWQNNDSNLDGAGMQVKIKRSGSTSILGGGIGTLDWRGDGEYITSTFSQDAKLIAGDILYVEVYQRGTSGSSGTINGGKFQAHLVFAD